ncbi:hypothetical protein [Parapedobacter defluvii]|uniref:hypothetical protein n=1 Tax=Parapedobacter defluvii TaxID=2045106 RepID=UPI000FC1162C|nr:MAG: hypothetical protein EAS52_05090 [Parapedobacter sp.]
MKLGNAIFFVGLWIAVTPIGYAREDEPAYIDLSAGGICNFVTDKQQLLRTQSVLLEEIVKRSGIDLPMMSSRELGKKPGIILTLESDTKRLPQVVQEAVGEMEHIGAEGYRLIALKKYQIVVVMGKDARGLLFGVGKLLRKATITPGSMLFPDHFSLATTPKNPIRGHQLGYRPKNNAYDAFSVAQFDQYIRELALFGVNCIELVPPRTDDDPTHPIMKLPPAQMMVELSRICDSYGLDVSMWYPNVGKDYDSPAGIQSELAEREEVFAALPRLDALFVPGGDPGDLEVDTLFRWVGQVAEVLRNYHPDSKIWISPQAFKQTDHWFDVFFEQANRRHEWFGGVVFGPWVSMPIAEIRNRLSPEIPIRRYPDITHNISCQYPVPDFDLTWALTLGRESINPRPREFKHIHNLFESYAIGGITYSEGTNDDVNKFVWSDQDWDSSTPVVETLRDYARLFLDPLLVEPFVLAIFALEDNLRGSPLTNGGMIRTLDKWRYLEQHSPAGKASNPRFQMGLIRAYFDAYTYRRLTWETYLEQQAWDVLRGAAPETVDNALTEAIALLKKGASQPVCADWRQRCLELADSLYESIGTQLTVERHHGYEERGNFIDHIDMPLNDAPWLLPQLEALLSNPSVAEKAKQLAGILQRTDPGPGGIYDNFSEAGSWQRVEKWKGWFADPGNLQSASHGFNIKVKGPSERAAEPKAWMKQATVLYDYPLVIHYGELDTHANYSVKIAYTGRFKSNISLHADGLPVHGYQPVSGSEVYEFDVPKAATSDGKVTFLWRCKPGERGLQVAELWLTRKERN